ncbi:MAG: hypothetical protein ACLFWM_10400, partial [Actinomycetota bacterium]
MHIHATAPARPWERRVALTPDSVGRLVRDGHDVSLEPGAGTASGYTDEEYRSAGATLGRPDHVDLILCVEPPDPGRLGGARAVLEEAHRAGP